MTSRWKPMPGSSATARFARWAVLSARVCRRRARQHRRGGSKSARQDPLELGKLNRRMDAALKGHAYVKFRQRAHRRAYANSADSAMRTSMSVPRTVNGSTYSIEQQTSRSANVSTPFSADLSGSGKVEIWVHAPFERLNVPQ